MQVKDMLELGEYCGLTTVSEAYSNVSIHAGQLFGYEQVESELKELTDELKERKLLVENEDGYFQFAEKYIPDALKELQ